MSRERLPISEEQGHALDVAVMGSLFLELVPEEPGQPFLAMTRLVPTAAGAAANFSRALASLGPRVGLITRLGKDELGGWLLRELEACGIDTSGISLSPDQLTPVSFACADLEGGKQFLFYRFPGYCDPLADLSPTDIDPTIIRKARVFDFAEAVIRSPGVREAAFHAARLCREGGGHVVYAVNYRSEAWDLSPIEVAAIQRQALLLADVALMNEEEYGLICGGDAAGLAGAAPPVLVVTAGERGGWVESGGVREAFSAWPVAVQYDVGAGDSFHAGYVAAYLEGASPLQAAQFAAACAALKIGRPPEAPPPCREEVRQFMG